MFIKIFLLLYVIFPLAIVLLGLKIRKDLEKNAKSFCLVTEGKIIDFRFKKLGGYPIIEYTVDNTSYHAYYSFQVLLTNGMCKKFRERKLKIYYDPSNPSNAIVADSYGYLPIILMFYALFLATYTFGMLMI